MWTYTREKSKSKYKNRIQLKREKYRSDITQAQPRKSKLMSETKERFRVEVMRVSDGASTSSAAAAIQVDNVIASTSTPQYMDIRFVRSLTLKRH